MIDKIKNTLEELQKSTSELTILQDLYQENLDYFNEQDRRKISEFNDNFTQKRDKIDASIKSFVRFIEKNFAPSPEEVLKEKVLQQLHNDFPDFDNWDKSVQESLLTNAIGKIKKVKAKKENKDNTQIENTDNTPIEYPQIKSKKIKSPTTGKSVCTDNPEPDRSYSINDNFTFCRPSSIVILGNRFSISTWREALCVIAQILYKKDEGPLRNYIARDISSKPIFSIESKNIYIHPIQIVEGVYTEANLSANLMLSRIKNLLEIYGVNFEDVKIYLRKIPIK